MGKVKETSQKGQIIVIGLLIMVVVLAVALSMVGRSITEINTATKTKNSSRAFSAAESGIEISLQKNLPGQNTQAIALPQLGNLATADVSAMSLPPAGIALEHPPISRSDFAQIWLGNPNDASCYYENNTFNVYFGNRDTELYEPDQGGLAEDKPALELSVIYWNGSAYQQAKYFIDSNDTRRQNAPYIEKFADCLNSPSNAIQTNDNPSTNLRTFYCQASISGSWFTSCSGSYPVLVRARILHSNLYHPIVIEPVGTCSGSPCSLPPQATIHRSTGSSADSQRHIEVFQQAYVLPYFMDFALYSASTVAKHQ